MNDPQPPARVAYFSMEIALRSDVPTYSGGLGVLAGDLLRSASDLALPLVGVTLASRQGYVRQAIRDGAQSEDAQPWDPQAVAERLEETVHVRIDGRDVEVGAWRYMLGTRCAAGNPVPVFLLDTDLPGNHPDDRGLTDALYGGDAQYRLKQEMVLGIGGLRLLGRLAIPVLKFHLNEGHAAFLPLELLRVRLQEQVDAEPEAAIAAVRRRCVFTTHTPVAAGHDQFDYDLVRRCVGDAVPAALLHSLAGPERMNMTALALHLSGWVNGVAGRHAEVARTLFPGYVVHAITNGVHAWSWASDAHRALYDQHIPRWCHEPELLVHAARIPPRVMMAAHAQARSRLLALAAGAAPAAGLQPGRLTLGFARRMTGYKRPHLLFQDLRRLRGISARFPLQLVFAGKAHPRDEGGKEEIERIHAAAAALAGDVPVVFLPGYDMDLARIAVAGCDVWVNTPQPPLEASGTSGMKAAVNGVPSLSVPDGWWVEGCVEGVTGWSIGNGEPADDDKDAESLYARLENDVGPLFFGDPERWGALMCEVASRNGALFNSHRMLRRYMLEAYGR